MRISDWSSDVCSSDLECRRPGVFEILHGTGITCGNGRRVADVLIGMELRFGIPGRTPFLEQRGSLFGNFTRSRQGTKRSINLRSQRGPPSEKGNDTEDWSEHTLEDRKRGVEGKR